ncbi:MAG: transglycosylase domain-containing protein [Myxococcota bacterium]|nr:transglycosylase domain-containing protein [Myxococcota bacterium]
MVRLQLRRFWRISRWGLVVAFVPLIMAIHAAVIVVVTTPFDEDTLVATSEPLVLLDLRGEEIATLPAVGVDRSRWTPLAQVPSIAVAAVIESEDHNFYRHRGVDGVGIARAMYLNVRGGRYGGSTLTMQLSRMVLGTNERSMSNKLREMLLAMRIERAVDKRTILEQWVNRAYFGNGAVGFDAAARLYFDKPVSALSDGEALLLAVLPRAPTGYDPLKHLERALRRRDYVLDMLVARGVVTAEQARDARVTELAIGKHVPKNHAPHFVQYVLSELPANVRHAGGTLHTTLDLQMQRRLQKRVSEQVATLARLNLDQAGLVVLDGQTSEVRVMVGSTGWSHAGGQINITTRRRHPGSALKPFVYAAAIERGANPASIAYDIRETSPGYMSGEEHGPVRYREALASSYNFAALDVIEDVGITRVMSMLKRAGVAELERRPEDYGPRLALGAAKVRLLDLAAGYGAFVNHGVVDVPHGIERAVMPDRTTWMPARLPPRRVLSPETAWLVMDMLADPEARRPGFGMELPVDLPFKIAVKTGTARGFADTWTVGATREAIVGAWAGTFDGTPTQGIVGMDAAAPLVRDAMLAIAGGEPLTLPAKPERVDDIEVCATSGMKPGEHCPRIRDHAHHDHAPSEPCTWHHDGITTYPARASGWLQRHARTLGAVAKQH